MSAIQNSIPKYAEDARTLMSIKKRRNYASRLSLSLIHSSCVPQNVFEFFRNKNSFFIFFFADHRPQKFGRFFRQTYSRIHTHTHTHGIIIFVYTRALKNSTLTVTFRLGILAPTRGMCYAKPVTDRRVEAGCLDTCARRSKSAGRRRRKKGAFLLFMTIYYICFHCGGLEKKTTV